VLAWIRTHPAPVLPLSARYFEDEPDAPILDGEADHTVEGDDEEE
jgi:hypothetical protein